MSLHRLTVNPCAVSSSISSWHRRQSDSQLFGFILLFRFKTIDEIWCSSSEGFASRTPTSITHLSHNGCSVRNSTLARLWSDPYPRSFVVPPCALTGLQRKHLSFTVWPHLQSFIFYASTKSCAFAVNVFGITTNRLQSSFP